MVLTARAAIFFSYLDIEDRVPKRHPLRLIRTMVNDALADFSGDFSLINSDQGRPSMAPEKLLRGLLLQAFYSIRSERQLMEQLNFNLRYRWFVGLGIDDKVWGHERVGAQFTLTLAATT